MTVQCCKCKKVHEDGAWVETQPADGAKVTHSYCPDCEDQCYIELFSAQASRVTPSSAQAVSPLVEKHAASA